MLETIVYVVLALFGMALGVVVAALVVGFFAYWVVLAAMLGWKFAESLVESRVLR